MAFKPHPSFLWLRGGQRSFCKLEGERSIMGWICCPSFWSFWLRVTFTQFLAKPFVQLSVSGLQTVKTILLVFLYLLIHQIKPPTTPPGGSWQARHHLASNIRNTEGSKDCKNCCHVVMLSIKWIQCRPVKTLSQYTFQRHIKETLLVYQRSWHMLQSRL